MTTNVYRLFRDEWYDNHMKGEISDNLENAKKHGFVEPQWGCTGHDECNRCGNRDDLWAISSDRDSGNRCLSCLFRALYSDWQLTQSITSAYLVVNNPSEWDIEDYERCYSCKESILGLSENLITVAYLSDGSDVIVHNKGRCRTNCLYCNNTYVSYDWSSNPQNTVSFRELYGDHRCILCYEREVEDVGGEDMLFNCGECGSTWHLDDSVRTNVSPGQVCLGCYENYQRACEDCEAEYWGSHDCYCEDEQDEHVHNYSYKPRPFFFGQGDYYLGIELEVECNGNNRNEGAEYIKDALGGRVYLKEDGSLNDGFEIVSHPHTLQEFSTNFDWSVLDWLRRDGYRSWNTDTCGLHVHVSRTAFGKLTTHHDLQKIQAHELRFMKLIYDNQRQVERIAGRTNNHYASFMDKGRLVHKVKSNTQSNGRYSAINTENPLTLEVRVFKGSLRKYRVMSAIEFVVASVEYTRNLKITGTNQALSWLQFTAYVAQNVEQYPNLANVMQKCFDTDSLSSND